MEKLERTQFGALVPNDEIIIAGYGLQGKDDNSGKRRLKFTRFKTFGFQDDTIEFTRTRQPATVGPNQIQ